MNSYHNTTHKNEPELSKSEAKCRRQEDIILDFFIKNPEGKFSSEDVHAACSPEYKKKNTPLTSTRRAISNLSAKSYIEKLDEMVQGSYGEPIYLWRYIKPQSQLTMQL